MTLVAISIGICLVSAIGFIHHHALQALGNLLPKSSDRPSFAIQTTFVGLLLLHVVEIVTFALANGWLMLWEGFGGPLSEPLAWGDVIYLTGVNFTTLGYTQIELTGDIRLVTMLQSLGGFMLLTWSATYLFTVCRETWKRTEEG